jgi:uncharacterized DUF497 family protein
VKITFDPAKRQQTLEERGLDFEACGEVFDGKVVTLEDRRKNYGEARFLSYGYLKRRMVAVAWTVRDGTRRVISMRKANDREKAEYTPKLK